MALALIGFGTAVPDTVVTQAEAVRIAERICCRSEGHPELLPVLYRQSGVGRRHLAFPREVMVDVLEGTSHSESLFLPQADPNDCGPTTSQRMQHYVREAGVLAIEASRQALSGAALEPSSVTHLVTIS